MHFTLNYMGVHSFKIEPKSAKMWTTPFKFLTFEKNHYYYTNVFTLHLNNDSKSSQDLMGKHLLCVPYEVFRFNIMPLLSLRDIGHLDAAVARKNIRTEVLQRFARYHVVGHVEVTALLARWLVKRKALLLSAQLSKIIYDVEVLSLAPVFSHVRKIVFRDCSRITDLAIITATKHCPQLEILIVNLCTNVTDTGIAAIAVNCTKLRVLDIGNNNHTKNDSLVSIAQQLGPRLEKLSIAWSPRLSDESLFAVSQHCCNLSVLDMSGCRKMTDAGRVKVAQRCPLLTSLDVSKSENVTDKLLSALSVHTKGLQTLKLTNKATTDVGYADLGRNCTHLHTLDLGLGYFLSDLSAAVILENCVHLRSLKLNRCYHLTDVSIMKLAEHCTQLELLLQRAVPSKRRWISHAALGSRTYL